MSVVPKLYFIGLLGGNDVTKDDWMATDMAVVATLLDDEKISSTIYSNQHFTSYPCCSSDGIFKYGDDRADRLAVPAPSGNHVIVKTNGTTLKACFLEKVGTTTKNMRPSDRLLIFLAVHGDDADTVYIGNVPLNKKELINVITPFKRIFLWSTACYSGQWVHEKAWLGYAAASADQQSDSLATSDSSYNRGSVNTLTTLAAFAQDQNVYFPPHPNRTNPGITPHYDPQCSIIEASNGLSLSDLASQANRIKPDLSWDYEASAVARDTQRALPLPDLTHEILSRFALIPRPSHISTNSQASESANKKGSAAFRQRLAILKFQWPASVNQDELIELTAPLLNCEPVPTGGHFVYLRKALEHPLSSPNEIKELLDAFRHRSNCQKCVEKFLQHGSWNSSYIPTWNLFRQPNYVHSSKVLTEFLAVNKESVDALRQMTNWRGWTGPPMIWTDIRIQLALAWDDAGRPSFSFEELEAIGARAEDLKKESILLSPSGQSSRPLQVIAHWPELRSALDDIGVLPDRTQPALRARKSLA